MLFSSRWVFLFLFFPSSVFASTITVTTTSDEVMTNKQCSLREAIVNSNRNKAFYPDCPSGSATEKDVIIIPKGIYLLSKKIEMQDYDGFEGDLDITDHLKIEGAGIEETVIDAGYRPSESRNFIPGLADRIFDVSGEKNIEVEIKNLQVKGGTLSGEHGGGISIELEKGKIKLISVKVTGNRSGFGGGVFVKIFKEGQIDFKNVEITENEGDSGGGLYLSMEGKGTINLESLKIDKNKSLEAGGGVLLGLKNNEAKLHFKLSTISHNKSKKGGGFYISHSGGEISLKQLIVDHNEASDDGGGFYLGMDLYKAETDDRLTGDDFYFDSSLLFLDGVSVTHNIAKNGGGFYLYTHQDNQDKISFIKTTITDNVVQNMGGAIYVLGVGCGEFLKDPSNVIKNNLTPVGPESNLSECSQEKKKAFEPILQKPPYNEDGFPIKVNKVDKNELIPADSWWIVAGVFKTLQEAKAFSEKTDSEESNYHGENADSVWCGTALRFFNSNDFENLSQKGWYYVIGSRPTQKEAQKRFEELKACFPDSLKLSMINPGVLIQSPALKKAFTQAKAEVPQDYSCWARYKVSPDLKYVAHTQSYQWPEDGGEAWGPWNVDESLMVIDLANKKRYLIYNLMQDAHNLEFSKSGRYLLFEAQISTGGDTSANSLRVFDTKNLKLYQHQCQEESLASCRYPKWVGSSDKIQYELYKYRHEQEPHEFTLLKTTLFSPHSKEWVSVPFGYDAKTPYWPSRQENLFCDQNSEKE